MKPTAPRVGFFMPNSKKTQKRYKKDTKKDTKGKEKATTH
jgi:hypothetical protein